MTKSPVSIVIPNHNHAQTLRACIASIYNTTDDPDWEIIVVDDGSTDGSLEYLQKLKGIRLIQQENKGIAGAINAGIKAAGKNDVVRLQSDTIIETKGWLKLFREFIESEPKAGIIGAKITRPDDTIDSIGRIIVNGLGLRDWYANQQLNQLDNPKFKNTIEVDTVPGAISYYRREMIDATGGLDESYFPEWIEDDDFCLMARYHNYKVFVIPTIKVVNYSSVKPDIFRTYFIDNEYQFNRLFAIKQEALNRHYEYWEKKWGWNPLLPDVNEIRRLYGHTEICWRIGEKMRYHPKDNPPYVDACMVTWNNLATLKNCMEALAATDYPQDKLTFYIVNNGSTDATKSYLDELSQNYPFAVKCIHLDVNIGAAPGLNTAFSQGKSEMVAKLDDDIIPPPNWLNTLLVDFQNRPYAGVVGGKSIYETPLRDIQCGAVHFFPQYFNHMHEVDRTQADYVARVAHVQGACCLYRRQTFKDCGTLDIRFNPSQFDDVEHHIRLYAMGYEVIYDGKMGFVHKFGFNAAGTATRTKISNSNANEKKLTGKWSDDIYMIIDNAIDLSREGRYLPDDGDTSKLYSFAPKPEEFPRHIPVDDSQQARRTAIIHYEKNEMPTIQNDLNLLTLDMVDKGLKIVEDRRDGGIEVFQQALYLRPYSVEALVGLATAYSAFGITDRLGLYLQRAQSLLDEGSGLWKEIELFKQSSIESDAITKAGNLVRILKPHLKLTGGKTIYSPTVKNRDQMIKAAFPALKKPTLKVLLLTNYSADIYRDMNIDLLQEVADVLNTYNIQAEVSSSPRPSVQGFDLVHVWGTHRPEETLRQLKGIRSMSIDIPIVLSPNYINFIEGEWVKFQLPLIYSQATSEEHLINMLGQLERDELNVYGIKRTDRHDLIYNGYERYQRETFHACDYMMPQSESEAFTIESLFDCKKPFSIWQYGINPNIFDSVPDEKFTKEFNLRDFILITDPFGWAQNQSLILTALGGSRVPIVMVGKVIEQNDMRVLRRIIQPNVYLYENMPVDLLLSAYKAARVHIAPGWTGTPVNSLKAGLAENQLVISNRLQASEYFENNAYYFDPADLKSAKTAIKEAIDNYNMDSARRKELKKHIGKHYSWEVSIEQLLSGYNNALAIKNKTLPEKLLPKRKVENCVSSPSKWAKPSVPTRTTIPVPISTSIKTKAKVDIVIPIYGQSDLLRKCVKSVLETTSNVQLILVDDCSPDDEIQNCFKEYQNNPAITLAHTPVNSGFIGATRYGASLGNSPYILFLNSDTEAIENGWLEKMLSQDETVGLVGAKLLYPPTLPGPLAGKIQHVGVARNDQGIPYHPFLGRNADDPNVNQQRDVNAVTGACYLVKRDLWDELGGWDERFGRGVYEDVDFSWRVRQKGLRVICLLDAVLYHYESASKSPDGKHQLNEHTKENLEKLLEKWHHPTSDEYLFFGEQVIRQWQKAKKQLLPIIEQLSSGKIALQKAEKTLENILVDAPEHVETLYTYAQVLANSGNRSKAVATLMKLIELAPAFWEARMILADQLYQAGNVHEANNEFQRIASIFPDHPEVQRRKSLFSQVTDVSIPVISQKIVERYDPEETYQNIINAEDLGVALDENKSRLDAEFLEFVLRKAQQARKDQDIDLAEGLENLAEYIRQKFEGK